MAIHCELPVCSSSVTIRRSVFFDTELHHSQNQDDCGWLKRNWLDVMMRVMWMVVIVAGSGAGGVLVGFVFCLVSCECLCVIDTARDHTGIPIVSVCNCHCFQSYRQPECFA